MTVKPCPAGELPPGDGRTPAIETRAVTSWRPVIGVVLTGGGRLQQCLPQGGHD
jgi:hypothetical protein